MSNTAYTITEKSLEQAFQQKMNPADFSALQRAYTAGLRFAFSPQTHGQVLQQFERDLKTHPDTAGVLGTDVAHLTILLVNESKGTMPQQIIGPCSVLLLAKACEFISTAHVAEITDVTFTEAVKVMAAGVTAALNPSYRQKVAGGSAPTQTSAPPSTGLLGQQTQGGA